MSQMSLVPMVIEKTTNGERAMDIYSRLLKDRIVMLHSDVNEVSASIVVAQMLFLEAEDPERDILFYINSRGGSVTDGMSIMDTMNFIRPNVCTIVMGQAASMGSLLAAAGTPGKRYILPNAQHMIHDPSGGFHGIASDVKIQADQLLMWREKLLKVYEHHTGQPKELLRSMMDRDTFLSAEDSIKFGLADKIISHR
jgi:ATP-dependent Clp protease protease subunit